MSFRDSIRDNNAGAYLLFFLAFLFFNFLGLLLQPTLGFHVMVIVAEVLGILGAALIWRRAVAEAAAPWPSWRLEISPVSLLIAALAAVIIGFFANATMALAVELSPWMKEFAQAYAERMARLIMEAEGLNRVLGIIGICVAAPLCEEALFRGTILQEERKREGVLAAVLINGVLFSAFHVNPVAFVGLAIIGSYLAHLTIVSGSIIPAIVGHATVNTVNGVVLPELIPQAAGAEVPVPMSSLLIALGILLVLTVVLWRWSISRMRRETGD